MSRHVRAKAPRLTTRPELSVNVPPPAAPLPPKNTPLSPSPKRRWFAKLASLVSRLRPAPRSPTSSSSSATTPSTATSSSSAFSRSPAALTATWVNTTAQATAPAAQLNPRAWPASAVSLQHPPVVYAPDRTRHQSLGAVMQAPAPQPVALYSIPPGPTALSPSPYMLGRTASASAATISTRPQRERERERGRRRGASVSQLQQVQPPHASTSASAAAYYSHSHAHAHAHTFPPTSHSAPALHGPPPPPRRSLPPRPAIPSIPPARAPPQSRPPVAYSHAQIHGWYSPDSSPSTIRRDSFDSAPSVWATPESQPGRRLSGATCISSGTFGV